MFCAPHTPPASPQKKRVPIHPIYIYMTRTLGYPMNDTWLSWNIPVGIHLCLCLGISPTWHQLEDDQCRPDLDRSDDKTHTISDVTFRSSPLAATSPASTMFLAGGEPEQYPRSRFYASPTPSPKNAPSQIMMARSTPSHVVESASRPANLQLHTPAPSIDSITAPPSARDASPSVNNTPLV
jgi:hypothetical protein